MLKKLFYDINSIVNGGYVKVDKIKTLIEQYEDALIPRYCKELSVLKI